MPDSAPYKVGTTRDTATGVLLEDGLTSVCEIEETPAWTPSPWFALQWVMPAGAIEGGLGRI